MQRLPYVRLTLNLAVLLMFFCSIPGIGHSADVTLSWDKPTNSSPIDGYRIYYGISGTDYKSAPMITVDSANQTSVLISGLEEGQIYGFAATSFDAYGNESAFSSDHFHNVPVSTTDPNPSDPTDPSDPTEPTDPSEPTDPTDPVDGGSGGTPPGFEIIVDNGDAGTSSTGTWKTSGGSSYYGSRSVYSNEAGTDYTFEATVSGTYEVSLWWTEYSNRSTEVPVEIWSGNTLLDTVTVNQQANGGQWNVLGTYRFSGPASIVVVSESGSSTTCADAVRLTESEEIPNSPPEVILDNGGDGTFFSGTWKTSGGSSYYGSRSVYSNEIGADYTFETTVSGTYEVSLWWTEYSNRSTAVPVEIWSGNTLLDTVTVNQQANGGQWNVLGSYNFSGPASIVIVSDSSSTTCADAVKMTQ